MEGLPPPVVDRSKKPRSCDTPPPVSRATKPSQQSALSTGLPNGPQPQDADTSNSFAPCTLPPEETAWQHPMGLPPTAALGTEAPCAPPAVPPCTEPSDVPEAAAAVADEEVKKEANTKEQEGAEGTTGNTAETVRTTKRGDVVGDETYHYNDEKTALALAMAVYFNMEFFNEDGAHIAAHTRETLEPLLHSRELADVVELGGSAYDAAGGPFDIAWGPVCWQAAKSYVADNTLLMVRHRAQPYRLVLSICGTHPLSVQNWFQYNMDVVKLAPWPWRPVGPCSVPALAGGFAAAGGSSGGSSGSSGGGFTSYVRQMWHDSSKDEEVVGISNGTLRGLELILTLSDAAQCRRLMDTVRDIAAARRAEAPGAPFEITVTGHSLGGALATAMAMYLRCRQRLWDPDGACTVRCVTFGSPTCGNRLFAEWYDRELGATTKRVHCHYDVVPYAWDPATLAQLEHLYDPYIKMPRAIALAVPLCIRTVAGFHYQHVRAGAASPEFVDLPPNRKLYDYTADVCAQHIRSYFNFYQFQPLFPMLLDHVPIWKDIITFASITPFHHFAFLLFLTRCHWRGGKQKGDAAGRQHRQDAAADDLQEAATAAATGAVHVATTATAGTEGATAATNHAAVSSPRETGPATPRAIPCREEQRVTVSYTARGARPLRGTNKGRGEEEKERAFFVAHTPPFGVSFPENVFLLLGVF